MGSVLYESMERERSVLDMMDADEFNHGGGKSNTIMVVLYRLPIIAKRKDSGDGRKESDLTREGRVEEKGGGKGGKEVV